MRPMSSSKRSGCGFHARYLRINVSDLAVDHVPLGADVLRRFVGGCGLGTWLMLREAAAEHDPLAPEAPIAVVFSALVGSPLTTSAKFAVVCKSPLTNRLNDSLASGGFALAGKSTGVDAMVIVGAASRPSVLIVDDGVVRLEAADGLWNTTCEETEARLKQRYGPEFRAAVIGPAAERRVRFATISHAGRHAGRGGAGAVLGAKNIKAVLVRGTHHCRWAAPLQLASAARALSERALGPATAKYRELGTATNLRTFNRLNALPTRNFQRANWEGVASLAPDALGATHAPVRDSCAGCTIGCEHRYALDGVDGDSAAVRMEYESLFALGPLCGVADPRAVLTASLRCDQLGLDTISTGATIAFAMECVERGLLAAPWLRFGDAAALVRAVEEIGSRQGLGDRLAEGSRRLAQELGGTALEFAPHVKGLELPGYEPRAMQTMALGFAVGARGADHNRSGAYEVDFSASADRHRLTPAAAALAIETEDKAALMDSLILCKFLRGVFTDFYAQAAELLNLVTGWDTTATELQDTARRIVTAKKLFNIRAGWTPAEDTLPARFLEERLVEDGSRLSHGQLAAAVIAYNQGRGWSDEGWLGPEAMEQLGLGG